MVLAVATKLSSICFCLFILPLVYDILILISQYWVSALSKKWNMIKLVFPRGPISQKVFSVANRCFSRHIVKGWRFQARKDPRKNRTGISTWETSRVIYQSYTEKWSVWDIREELPPSTGYLWIAGWNTGVPVISAARKGEPWGQVWKITISNTSSFGASARSLEEAPKKMFR